MRLYIRHFRALKYCMGGTRKFFRKQGLDWSVFLRDGLSLERAKEIDNAMFQEAVKLAEREQVNDT